MDMRRVAGILGALAVVLAQQGSRAEGVPDTLSFTARILENDAPATGAHALAFKLFTVDTGGMAVWEEPQITLTVREGLVFHDLGKVEPLDASVFTGARLYLELSIDGTITMLRIPIESVPYAFRAAVAENAETLGTHAPEDFITGVANGPGLTGGGSTGDVTLGVAFAGSGTATTVAHSDHHHAGAYLPVGTSLSCSAGRVTGLETDGDVICGADPAPGTGLTAGFNVNFAGSGSATTVAHSDHHHAGTYLPLGAALSCPTGKVTGLDGAGNVT